MVIYKAKDYQDMSRKAANIISAQIIMKPNCVLGLATGSSPVGTYKQLIEWLMKGRVIGAKEQRCSVMPEYIRIRSICKQLERAGRSKKFSMLAFIIYKMCRTERSAVSHRS